MLTFRKPAARVIQRFIEKQRITDFSYSAVGATAKTPPLGYVVDRIRVILGQGEKIFLAAKAALERWEHFRLGWVEAWPSDTPIRTGEVVAIVARVLGFWWLNACRIVYTIDEDVSVRRFGYAYGTLAEHAESGEERFLIEWNPDDDSVCYDILAFSRPRHPLARLAYPLTRRFQRRFARDSAAATQRAVEV